MMAKRIRERDATPFEKAASPLLFLTLLLAACATERAYDGPALPASERAIVSADTALSAGLPVQLRLRQADGRDLPLTANAVELPPGMHVLLVDCRVTESGATQRFTVEAELEPGAEYRLVAVASARNCEAVTLQRR
jgi:hypothetical protein